MRVFVQNQVSPDSEICEKFYRRRPEGSALVLHSTLTSEDKNLNITRSLHR